MRTGKDRWPLLPPKIIGKSLTIQQKRRGVVPRLFYQYRYFNSVKIVEGHYLVPLPFSQSNYPTEGRKTVLTNTYPLEVPGNK